MRLNKNREEETQLMSGNLTCYILKISERVSVTVFTRIYD